MPVGLILLMLTGIVILSTLLGVLLARPLSDLAGRLRTGKKLSS